MTTAREEEDGEAAFGGNKRARGNGPNARGGQPGRRRRTKRLTMVNHRRRPTGSKAAGRRRVMEGVVGLPVVSSAEASRVPSEGEDEEEELRMEEYEDSEEEEEEEEQGPVKLECTEESAAFLQQAAEVEHRHLHQHHHLHHTLQLSHLEPERTQPSVYSPLVRPFRSADAISICVGSRADSLPLCCDMTAEAPRGAANAGHGCGL